MTPPLRKRMRVSGAGRDDIGWLAAMTWSSTSARTSTFCSTQSDALARRGGRSGSGGSVCSATPASVSRTASRPSGRRRTCRASSPASTGPAVAPDRGARWSCRPGSRFRRSRSARRARPSCPRLGLAEEIPVLPVERSDRGPRAGARASTPRRRRRRRDRRAGRRGRGDRGGRAITTGQSAAKSPSAPIAIVFRAGRIVAGQPSPAAVIAAATNGRLPAVTAIARQKAQRGEDHENMELAGGSRRRTAAQPRRCRSAPDRDRRRDGAARRREPERSDDVEPERGRRAARPRPAARRCRASAHGSGHDCDADENASARGETSSDAQANATATTGTARREQPPMTEPLSTDGSAQAARQCVLDRDVGRDHGDGNALKGRPQDGRVLRRRAAGPRRSRMRRRRARPSGRRAGARATARQRGRAAPSRRRSRGRARRPSTGIRSARSTRAPATGSRSRAHRERSPSRGPVEHPTPARFPAPCPISDDAAVPETCASVSAPAALTAASKLEPPGGLRRRPGPDRGSPRGRRVARRRAPSPSAGRAGPYSANGRRAAARRARSRERRGSRIPSAGGTRERAAPVSRAPWVENTDVRTGIRGRIEDVRSARRAAARPARGRVDREDDLESARAVSSSGEP